MISQVKPETCADRVDGGSPPASRRRFGRPTGARRDRYAIVVVLEAESPDEAWEAVRRNAGIGCGVTAPRLRLHRRPLAAASPSEAEDLSTDHLELGDVRPQGPRLRPDHGGAALMRVSGPQRPGSLAFPALLSGKGDRPAAGRRHPDLRTLRVRLRGSGSRVGRGHVQGGIR